MRDRLRAIECPAEMVDQIGGWARVGIGAGYGEGYSSVQLLLFLEKFLLTEVSQKFYFVTDSHHAKSLEYSYNEN